MHFSLKIISLLFVSICLLSVVNCQLPYWQQQVNYTIDVTLNDKENTLHGFEKIEYINNSPDTLRFIWIHLWPNAYKNVKTTYSKQLIENGNTKFYFSNEEEKGYIDSLDFKVNNVTIKTEAHPQYIDIIKLILPVTLVPGQKINITTPFHVKLPFNFSRSGHVGQSYQVTQWYPKPAVYDQKGWHPIPYLDQGEFYSEFGNYQVNITLPKNYVVAATGDLQNKDEHEWLKTRSAFSWIPEKEKIKTKNGKLKTVTQVTPTSSSDLKTLEYKQDNVHDFAWFADKLFIVNSDTCKLPLGKIIDVYSYYTAPQKYFWKNSVQYIKEAVRTRSEWVGEYPYNIVSTVQGPESFGGGMEYPTITVISPIADERTLEYTIAHEVTHNWFYGILGSNERLYPWMDEGLNTYYDNRHSQWKYRREGEIKVGASSFSINNSERIFFETKATIKKDQPINTSGDEFTEMNYNLVAYYKTGAWLEMLETKLSKGTFDKAMQEYYREWQFRHPYPENFKQTMETISGQNLDKEFSLLDKKGLLPGIEKKEWKIATPLSPKTIVSYIKGPSKNWLLLSPIAGINKYDKIMPGALITNYKFPPSPFQFFLMPMYSIGAKKLTGIGKMNYTFYPDKALRKIDLFMNASKFSNDEFIKNDGSKSIAGFQKLVPGIRFTINEKNARNTLNRFIQWKSFFISEESFDINNDTTINGLDTSVIQSANLISESRTLQQLKIVVENYRALYPYSAELNIEQGKNFIRAGFTGKYFVNYRKEGGLDIRVFAGKFFYLGSTSADKKQATKRYQLNMTGPNGYEDYTYSDYFYGRNKTDGLPSQQIMMRDGGFKIRTDLYDDKIGKTDNWLATVNLATSIPSSINPLSLLPVKIPLKIFADIGTYAEAWKKDANLDHFIFDAGLQLSFFSNVVNIYIPLVYSNIYKNYIHTAMSDENRFIKKISFSLDISNFSLRKISKELDF